MVDDGSTDSTPLLMDYLVSEDPRIKYIRQDNKGISIARNKAVKASTMPFIAVMDSDDLMTSDRLKLSLKAILKSNADVVYGSYMQATDDSLAQGKFLGSVTPANIMEDTVTLDTIITDQIVPHVTILAKRECFVETPYRQDFTSNDDQALIFDWFKKKYTFKMIKDPLMVVRYHERSTSTVKDKEIKRFTEILRKEAHGLI